jgi:threonine dehydrogenase-like Zn-dependent dehydrogenase
VNGGTRVRVGDRVAINVITGCGTCLECLSGDRRFCLVKQGYVMNGHAQYVAVPEATCLPLPDEMGFDLVVLIGGDTLGVASRALAMIPLRPRETVLVAGAGPVGLGFVALLAFLGIDTIVSEPSPYRRALVEKMGARTIDPTLDGIIEQLLGLNGGKRVDVAVDASGKSEGVNLSLEATRPRGRMIFAGAGRQASINPWRHFLEKEITAYGVWYFTDTDYFRLLGFCQQGLDVEHLITHRFDIAAAPTAYQVMASGQCGKAVLHANGPVSNAKRNTGKN